MSSTPFVTTDVSRAFRDVESGASTEMSPWQDPRPLGGYSVLLGTYSLGAMVAIVIMRDRREAIRRLDLKSLVLLALATQHLSRLIAKDSITAVLRAPFTRFVQATSEGEVDEAVVGEGLRRAIGELLTSPFGLAEWVATALVAGTIAVPNLTAAVTTVCALARTSDYLQLLYDHSKRHG